MANISKTYPFNISDKDLEDQTQDLVKLLIENISESQGIDPIKLQTLLSLGQTELLNRITRSTDRYSKRLYWLTWALIFISVIQIIIGLDTIYESRKSDAFWNSHDNGWIDQDTAQFQQESTLLTDIKNQLWSLRHGK